MAKTKLTIIKNVSLFDGIQIKKHKTVLISNDKILDIKTYAPTGSKYNTQYDSINIIDGKENLLTPGFIDIQVNGGGGVLFNDEPTMHGVQKIFESHLKYGTTSILPTFISDSFENLKKSIITIENLCKIRNSGILGLHIEGPFLNIKKAGIHPIDHLLEPSKEWSFLLLKANIPTLLVTLAPEMVSQNFISALVKHGIHVFAGHTNATEKIMKDAFDSGIRGITHLFNACSQITARDIGVVGSALLNKNILCSLIIDGHHLSYDALKLAFAIKDSQQFILISDAMPTVGSKLKEFLLFKEKLYLQQNRLCNANGVLGGAHLTMFWAFKNLIKQKLVKIEDAIKMTSTNQAKFFNLKNKGAVLPNHDANLLLLDKNSFNILKIFFFGETKKSRNF